MEKRTNKTTGKSNSTQKKQALRKQFDPSYQGSSGEINTKPSKTVPDQNKSIQQLLHNHTRGINTEIHEYKGEYFDSEIPIITDLTDTAIIKEDLKEQETELENQIKDDLSKAKQKKVLAKEKAEKAQEKLYNEAIKAKEAKDLGTKSKKSE